MSTIPQGWALEQAVYLVCYFERHLACIYSMAQGKSSGLDIWAVDAVCIYIYLTFMAFIKSFVNLLR